MIKKYDKFIIESLLETMILEANITYKNDFRDVLTSLKKKEVGYDDVVSEIATFLLSIID
jgi:4-hydroxy-3-methylbut-2-en-1-yl diphosphate synthase IspG/GcpE